MFIGKRRTAYFECIITINAETSDLNPSVMCTSKSKKRHSLCFSFLLCSKYCLSYTTMMEDDEEFSFDRYEIVDENEQIDIDTTFNLEDLHTSDQSDMMEIDEQSSFENYEIINSNSRKILDRFLRVLDLNNTTDTNQISSQTQVINDLIEKSPFITMHNKDQSVRLQSKTEYSIQAIYSVYDRTRAAADGNSLYSSLSILNFASEKLTHSMRFLAVNAMINNRDYFQTLCKSLDYSFEEQLTRTAKRKIWGGEVQIQALSIALSHPIYSYIRFDNDPTKEENRHYIPLNISLQELISRFNKRTVGGHMKYIGYKFGMNKLGFYILLQRYPLRCSFTFSR